MSQITPLRPPMMANFTMLKGTVPSRPELNARGKMVIKSEVENSAKNAIEAFPLLLHRKCHKLCIRMERKIRLKARSVIKKLRIFSWYYPINISCRNRKIKQVL